MLGFETTSKEALEKMQLGSKSSQIAHFSTELEKIKKRQERWGEDVDESLVNTKVSRIEKQIKRLKNTEKPEEIRSEA